MKCQIPTTLKWNSINYREQNMYNMGILKFWFFFFSNNEDLHAENEVRI